MCFIVVLVKTAHNRQQEQGSQNTK